MSSSEKVITEKSHREIMLTVIFSLRVQSVNNADRHLLTVCAVSK